MRWLIAALVLLSQITAGNANFAIFQAAASAPALVCTFISGTCTGTGGPVSFTAATCNGSTDDSSAFASFNAAIVIWQGSNSGQVQLTWPVSATCLISGNTVTCATNPNQLCPFISIKSLLIAGNSGTLSIASGKLISLGGLGLIQDNAHSARTASANKGDTCASLITSAQSSLFSVGAPVMMSGFDLQSIWNTPQGFPPNPQFWDHLHVASVDTVHQCDGTTSGASVHFTSALSYQYLSTWPNYNSGSAFDIDPGGPATLYAKSSTWDATVEVDNLTITYAGQVIADNDTIIYKNVTFTNNCAIPSQNRLFEAINTNFGTCNMESDKVSDTMVTQNITASEFFFQSSSPKVWQDTGSTITQMQGSPLAFSGSGTTFTSIMKPGAVGFGRTNSFSCTNCSVASLQDGGISDTGLGHGVQNTYTMSAGTIKVPNGTRFTSVQSNGGLAQIVVTSSAGWATNQYTQLGGGTGTYSGVWKVIVDDPTHMTLQGSTFSTTDTGWVCSAGGVGSGNCSVEWGAPGTNIIFSGANGKELIGQVTGVTQDANFAYVATTGLGSTFPADVTSISTHMAPIFNCPGCTGADTQIASLAQAPANAPLYSYQTYTYPGTIGTTAQPTFEMWGALSQIGINVTSQSAGASQFHLSRFDNWPVYVSGSTSTYGPSVAAGTAGSRTVNSAGTCTGCVAGDSMTTPSGLWFGGSSSSGPQFATAPSAGASVTVTIQTNQGVVNP